MVAGGHSDNLRAGSSHDCATARFTHPDGETTIGRGKPFSTPIKSKAVIGWQADSIAQLLWINTI